MSYSPPSRSKTNDLLTNLRCVEVIERVPKEGDSVLSIGVVGGNSYDSSSIIRSLMTDGYRLRIHGDDNNW